jgi:hypothetical protein
VEASANSPGLWQTIEMFNFVSGQYEQVEAQLASFNADSVLVVDLTKNAVQYIETGTGTVQARIGWKSNGIVLAFPWTICIDQVVWSILE